MSHMQLFASFGVWCRVTEGGEDRLIPREHVLSSQVVTEESTGWCARYSAPGYMDCTDWCGPYPTREQAERECEALYGDDDDSDADA